MFKKATIIIIIITYILLSIVPAYGLTINSESALLFDLNTGSTLFSYNAKQRMYPASVTKIMTCILALELGDLKDVITVDEETPYEIYGSKISLEPGEILTLKDLLYALMLPSANDAASVIAKHYAGSIEEFAKLMNKKALELEAINTNFVNPHGLHDDNHYTTASDLKKIVIYAMKNETFREIVKTKRYIINATNKKEERILNNGNNLILNTSSNIYVDGLYVSREYEGALGIKPGYTEQAGNCLVSYAKKNNMDLVAIVLKGSGPNVYTDTHNLLNYGFNNFKTINIIKQNMYVEDLIIKDENNKTITIPLITKNPVNIISTEDEVKNIEKQVKIYGISPPIKKEEVVGKIEFLQNGEVIGSTELISTKSVANFKVDSSTEITTQEPKKGLTVPPLLYVILAIVIGLFVLRTYNKIRIAKIRKRRRIKREMERQREKERQQYETYNKNRGNY